MSQIHAMNDDQVASELKKMTTFIMQEAKEKAEEIRKKAREEFSIEKSKLVREETSSIDAEYAKKFKSAGMSETIVRSTVANKSRLRILSGRQEVLDGIFEKARADVGKAADGKEYGGILKGLILEGMYALNESSVMVRAREKDYSAVKEAIKAAEGEYKEKVGRESKASINEKDPLPSESAGGVSIVGGAGKIDIDNTFEARLRLLELEALPQMRAALFGENANRKFRDS